MDKLKILVAGSDSTTTTIIMNMAFSPNVEKIYALPYNELFGQLAELVDIRENDVNAILDFVNKNDIDLTIITSPILIVNGIANLFEANGKNILAPFRESAIVTYFNAAAKKTMYKLKIPTPRFAIFDKCPNAISYIRQIKFPLYVEPDFKVLTTNKILFNYFSEAKKQIEDLFFNNEERIVIEEFTGVNEYNLYFLTDGYSALFLGSTQNLDNDITVSPAINLPNDLIQEIRMNVIEILLDDISKFYAQYKGILGVKILYDGEDYKVTDFMSNFENCDLETILPNIQENIVSLFYSAATGSLTDDYSEIKMRSRYSCATRLDENNDINKLNLFDGYIFIPMNDGGGILTVQGSTITSVTNKMKEILNEISR